MLFLGVDDENSVRNTVEVGDTAQVAVELLQLAAVAKSLALGHVLEVSGALHCTQLHHALHPTSDGREVGEHATQPTLVDEGHPTRLGVVRNGALGLLLGAHEQDDATPGDEVTDVGVTRLDACEGFSKIDQVDAVALAQDKATHFRVPSAGLVPEVHTRVQQFLQSDKSHVLFPSVRLLTSLRCTANGDRTKPQGQFVGPPTLGEPVHVSR